LRCLSTANDPVELFPGTILQTREATRPKMTKSPQPPNSAFQSRPLLRCKSNA
jgi:hypothetical protein